MNKYSHILNTKVLLSGAMIAAAAAVVIGATFAFFSDTETSTGNVFAAGEIDLKVDAQAHYAGLICRDSTEDSTDNPVWEDEAPEGTTRPDLLGDPCDGTWVATDLTSAHKFFNVSDIKPGDDGENTISLHVNNNDAWVCADLTNLTSNDNTLTEPEAPVDGDGLVSGELEDHMLFTIWWDNGAGDGGVEGDNIQQPGEPTITSGTPTAGVLPIYDSNTGTGPLLAADTGYIGVGWELPVDTGDVVQTDSLSGDISFSAVQSRNNEDFVCGAQ